ncbi:type II toxin-antitoxin system HicB family antitoxin [Phormidesmis priestleyi ULC007]|uniref:Type II toxin-antitoxin system HicB family antitoxin n=1 Tax=Phormidesmis priestleyi ULC007 TaxID=1920490 RepID=A0A2T1DAY2_9CYAN|nr:type II toxin-antitoxin system HicB family antitoxin [Phormidesmis priestleyi]PSB17603.1 type II toxin-antitoxin system HicB family antitoxin [Phormidesmis priestleyi ULC007]PZO48480.1 MAG: type II toxin-antitoxin system HicB family antitoxin [Phormidesmis priestleyi]
MLNYLGYTASLSIDEKAELVCGKVNNVSRELLHFQGKTVEKAKEEFEKTIDTYLKFCKLEKVEPEKPENFSGKLPFRTSPEVHRNIAHTAKDAGRSINSWLEEAAIKALQESKTDEKKTEEVEIPATMLLQLKKHPELMEQFLDQVTPSLKKSNAVGAIDFLSAVEKVLPGLEAIRSHLRTSDPQTMTKVVSAIEDWIERTKMTKHNQTRQQA